MAKPHVMRLQANDSGRRATAVPWELNLGIVTIVLAIYLSLFVGVSLLRHHHLAVFVGVLLIFLVSTPAIWGLVHEGIHGRLLGGPTLNRASSRILCVLLGFSFDVVQFGHLMHHRYNGHELDRPDRTKPGESRWLSLARHYGHLLGGHYLFTALAGLLAFAPARLLNAILQLGHVGTDPDMVAIRAACLKWFSKRNRILRIRFDCLLSLVFIIVVFRHFGSFWPLFLLALLGRAIVYSTLDNLPHYGLTGRGHEAAKNLALPRWASLIVLHHNLHRIHHQRPELPWRTMSRYFGTVETEGSYLHAAIRQFKGPTRC